ncbi:MAG: glutamate synthase [Omnitrophica WOR_2 bacterium RIFCSPHIGHO2_02_FULL_45_21]|nr:MAG: glutamate synthase [Omnitrophica WOR_2 bacterium RIFCSPHIGHO2_02_FULL_45_21]
MAQDIKGFLKVKRKYPEYRPVCERVKDYSEVAVLRRGEQSKEQALRCMDCGTPFCHWGCPLGNYIPEWNELIAAGLWKKAIELLQATNNLPEITGRLCPAPCEFACVLGINDDPVTVRENELAIIEHGFKAGFIKPLAPEIRSGKKVAVIGSGPAGLCCAAQVNKAGHKVTVFEKDDKIGGILRYGIPDFKLDKWLLERRIKLLKKEGITFKTGVNVGIDYPVLKLLKEFDAIALSGGSRVPRDLKIEGRELSGINFAMDYLTQSNRRAAGELIPKDGLIDAKGKRVLVIGGGDSGADCVGTAHRQGASCVIQIEVMPKPSECRTEDIPWPRYPLLLKTSTSHEEGGERQWAVLTKKFIGEKGRVRKVSSVRVEFSEDAGRGCPMMKEIPGSGFEIETDLVILAIGFVYPEPQGLLKQLKVKLDSRGNVKTNDNYMTSQKGVFSAGDMRRGQSLIVWAISEGRAAAMAIDEYLMGKSRLPALRLSKIF